MVGQAAPPRGLGELDERPRLLHLQGQAVVCRGVKSVCAAAGGSERAVAGHVLFSDTV